MLDPIVDKEIFFQRKSRKKRSNKVNKRETKEREREKEGKERREGEGRKLLFLYFIFLFCFVFFLLLLAFWETRDAFFFSKLEEEDEKSNGARQ